uniref:hypothetical protein n=1 Tax=Amycolatopsis sp. CA-096443 TaxID=3239919 RepID=UPI003F4981CD
MNTALAVENDPYVVAMPAPDSPVVQSRWISPGNTHPNSVYRDPIWSLASLIDNPGTSLRSIHWRHCPSALLGEMKLAAWTMINGRLRPTYLQTRGVRARGRASALEMRETCQEWMRLARWLDERGINRLAGCTQAEWRAYARTRMTDDLSRVYAEMICSRLTDLWAFDQLAARPSGIARPPWDAEGVDDFLPAVEGGSGGENSTEPLDPQVLGPLLVWAIRFVDDFADDILAAWAEVRRLTARVEATSSTPTGGGQRPRRSCCRWHVPALRCPAQGTRAAGRSPSPTSRPSPAPASARSTR